jgi:hypothetical protein
MKCANYNATCLWKSERQIAPKLCRIGVLFLLAISLPLPFSCAQVLAVGAIWVGATEKVQEVLCAIFGLLGFRNL